MDHWRLGFVLLLSICLCFEAEVIIDKTIWRGLSITDKESEASHVRVIGEQPDLTPICSNETLNIVILVNCKINTSRWEECVLRYQLGHDIADSCGSSFTLLKKNRTIYLQMTSLTPEDGGIYTCECSRSDGRYALHLNITVEELPPSPLPVYLWTVTIIPVAGVILGIFMCKNKRSVNSTRSGTSSQQVPKFFPSHANSSRHLPGKHNGPGDIYQIPEPTSDNYVTINQEKTQHNSRGGNAAWNPRSEGYVNIQSYKKSVKK